MKENEVPEKIFIRSEAIFKALNKRRKESDIEYTRTDALIEKIEEWLIKHSEDVDYTWYDEIEHASGITDKFIEDLLNYIKEE